MNGKKTLLTETEVTILLEFMKQHNNRTDLAGQQVVEVTETSMANALRIDLAYQQIEMLHKQIESMLKDENAKLKVQNQKLEQKNQQLQIELDSSKEWDSVKRMEKLNPDKEFKWSLLKKESTKLGKEVKKVFDQNYGEVNAYHISV